MSLSSGHAITSSVFGYNRVLDWMRLVDRSVYNLNTNTRNTVMKSVLIGLLGALIVASPLTGQCNAFTPTPATSEDVAHLQLLEESTASSVADLCAGMDDGAGAAVAIVLVLCLIGLVAAAAAAASSSPSPA